jgi:hypothetical protein
VGRAPAGNHRDAGAVTPMAKRAPDFPTPAHLDAFGYLSEWRVWLIKSPADEWLDDTLRQLANQLELGQPLPRWAAKWAADYIRKSLEKPRRGERGPTPLVARDRVIVDCIQFLIDGDDSRKGQRLPVRSRPLPAGYNPHRHNIPPTRNDATEKGGSLCDAVAWALRKLGVHLGYDRVKDIWEGRKGT